MSNKSNDDNSFAAMFIAAMIILLINAMAW